MASASDSTTVIKFPRLDQAVIKDRQRFVQETLKSLEETLRDAYGINQNARADAQARSQGMDYLVTQLSKLAFSDAEPGKSALKGIAVIATGGYGRSELSPHSDIDLLFAIDGKRLQQGPEELQYLSQSVLYPLWDAGLTVGHAVRSVTESIKFGQTDMTSRSALLDHRFLWGDRDFYRSFIKRIERDLFNKRKKDFVGFKLAELGERRRRTGQAVYRNEPELKDGEGGLRDAQTAMWIGQTVWNARTPTALAGHDLVTRDQVTEWIQATEYLMKVRRVMHFAAGRKDDRLSFERQSEIAQVFGHETNQLGLDVEHFMRELLIHQAGIQRFLNDVLDRLPTRYRPDDQKTPIALPALVPREFRLNEDRMTFRSFKNFERRAVDFLRILQAAAESGVPLHTTARQAIRTNLDHVDESVQRDPGAAKAFLSLLTNLTYGGKLLDEMNTVGLLGRFIPEFEDVFCRAQYDRYHVYTVDAHSVQAVKELHKVFRGLVADEEPVLTEVAARVERLPVIFGTFLHDIGKGAGTGHVVAGARMVPVICARLGLSSEDEALILFLETQHLLMSHVAQRRDLSDPETINDFVQKVGDVRRLRALYLLTYADIKAVGPKAWNQWKSSLLRELYLRSLAAFEGQGPTEQDHGAEIRNQASKMLYERFDSDVVDEFIGRFPSRYFESTNPEIIVEDFSVASLEQDKKVRVQARNLTHEGMTELTFYTKDEAGLFATLCGVLTGSGLSIQSARIYSTLDGFVLDRFHVTGSAGEPIESPTAIEQIVQSAQGVLEGSISVSKLLSKERSKWKSSAMEPTLAPTRVEVHNNLSKEYSVIDLFTQNRLGLLVDIAKTFESHDVDISVAIVSTKVDQAVDTFYVHHQSGRKLSSDELGKLESGLILAMNSHPA